MFCSKCGKQLPDNCAFCGQCGTPVAKAPVQPIAQPPVEEIPVEEVRPETVAEVPVAEAVPAPAAEAPVEAPVFAQFEAPKPKKKSKKKLIGWLSAAAAVVVAGAVAIGAFWEPLQGAWVENFGSDQDYMSYVEQNSTQKLTDTLSSGYGSVVEAVEKLASGSAGSTGTVGSGAYEMNMKLTVGDKVITMAEDMLEAEAGEKIELDWLSSIDIAMNTNVKDSLQQIGMALNIGETELAKLDMILNMDKGELFLAIPTLSDKYLKGELEMDMSAAMPSAGSEMLDLLSSEELLKALPTEDELNKLLDKYIGIIFDNLDDVEKSTKTVKISGVSQKLTVLKTTIDGDDVVNVATALMKAAKDDKQIEKIITNLAGFMEDNDLIEDADDAYDMFVESIEEALEAMEDADLGDELELVLTDYVNDAHEVVGRRIEVNGQQILYYAEVRDGGKVAFELETEGLQIYGDGTEKNGVVNAEYTLLIAGDELCTLTLVDFKSNAENVSGKIRIAPSSDFMEGFGKGLGVDSATASAIALLDPQLELVLENTKSSSKIEINLLSGSDMLVGIAISGKEATAGKITLPDDKNVYEQDEAEEWLQDLDVEKLIETLEDITDLPLSDLMEGNVKQEAQIPSYVPGGSSSSNVSGASSSSGIFGGGSSAVDATKAPTTAPAVRPATPEPSSAATEPTEPANTEPEDEVIYGGFIEEEEGTVTLPTTESFITYEDFISSGTGTVIIPVTPSTGDEIAVATFPVISGTVIGSDGSIIGVYQSTN